MPVPCASTASMSSGIRPLAASARRITRCWLGPFGAVRPWLRPSWLTALPRTTASTWSPSRRRPTDASAPGCRSPPTNPRRPRRPRSSCSDRPGPEPPQSAELHERQRRAHHLHAARERQIALALPKPRARQVQRHQRRRARRVHRHRRALQPEHVRHASRQHAARLTRPPVAIQCPRATAPCP